MIVTFPHFIYFTLVKTFLRFRVIGLESLKLEREPRESGLFNCDATEIDVSFSTRWEG